VRVGSDGPVIIDLPQAVNAAGNNGALAMLERDVNNIRRTLGRFAPELLETSPLAGQRLVTACVRDARQRHAQPPHLRQRQ